MNKQLAKIKSAGLEIKERGILNFWIIVDYEEYGELLRNLKDVKD